MNARGLCLSLPRVPLSPNSDLQGDRPTVQADGLVHDGSGRARRRRGAELLPLLREGLQQPGDADVREVKEGKGCRARFLLSRFASSVVRDEAPFSRFIQSVGASASETEIELEVAFVSKKCWRAF